MEGTTESVQELISDYRPNAIQERFHSSPARIRGIFGGSALGKSRCAGTEALILALEYPRNLIIIAREVLADLKRTTKVTFLQECMPPGLLSCKDVEWRESEQRLTFKHNGSEIHFIGLDEFGRLGSLNCGAWFIDEAHTLKDPERWFFALNRQTRRHGVRRCGVFSGHPQGKTSWFYKQFFQNKPPDWEIFTGGPEDNRANLPTGFIEQLKVDYASDPRYIRRYVLGDWEDFEGAVFSEFDPRRHMVEPFEIPPHWKRYRGMDYGIAEPTVCEWAAVADDGTVYFYDEYYTTNTPIEQQVHIINEKTLTDRIEATKLDARSAGLRQQTQNGLITISQQYLMAGLPCLPSATGNEANVEAGVMRVKNLFASDKIRIMKSGWVGGRHYGCPKLVDEIIAYCFASQKEGQPMRDKFQGHDDHCIAAMRYLIQGFLPASYKKPPQLVPGTIAWDIHNEINRGRMEESWEWD